MADDGTHGWASCPKAGVALILCTLGGLFFFNVLTGLLTGAVLSLFLHYGTCKK